MKRNFKIFFFYNNNLDKTLHFYFQFISSWDHLIYYDVSTNKNLRYQYIFYKNDKLLLNVY